MRAIIGLIIAASAYAFAPAAKSSTQSALNALAAKDQQGAIPPLGFFDPLGLVKNGPYGSEEDNFKRYRSVEIKHGRIAMAAVTGMLVQQNAHFDGFCSPSMDLKFADIPNGLGALSAVPAAGWCQMIITIGLHEVLVRERDGRPGDFGTGYLGMKMDDQSADQIRALNVELSNGRLAMLGILGMFASENIHGTPLFEVTQS